MWQWSQRFSQLPAIFYTFTQPKALPQAAWVQQSEAVATLLGLTSNDLQQPALLDLCCAHVLPTNCQPLAQGYAGHQFGKFNPFLGDGRVVLLGDVQTPTGHCEISLKGAGRTAYARTADGRAGVNECLKEFQLSERLAALKIPTLRCLGVLQSNSELVYRQSFEPAALLVRVMPSHIRFGTFELAYFQKNYANLQQLADFVLAQHYVDLVKNTNPYAALLTAIVSKTAQLIAQWQAVGFTHGVMNTDNMSVVGISLDLGSSSFNANFADDYVSSALDEKGRYAFGQQPIIGLWNCNVLARTFSPLINSAAIKQALQHYEPTYLDTYNALK